MAAEVIESTFRGIDEADCEQQARQEALRAAADGFVVSSREWGSEGSMRVLRVRYEPSAATFRDPGSPPLTGARVIAIALLILAFVGLAAVGLLPR